MAKWLHILRLGLAGTTISMAAAAASAQDGQEDLAFDGFFLGAGIGGVDGSGDTEFPIVSGGTSFAPFDSGTGQLLSVYGGYQFRRDAFVYGIEANWANLSDVSDGNPIGPENREITDVGDIRGRIGYVTGDLMIYGALGWSWANYRIQSGGGLQGRDNDVTLDGLNYGAGVEYSIGDRWTLGADLTFRDLSGDFDDTDRSTDIDVDTLSVRLGFQF